MKASFKRSFVFAQIFLLTAISHSQADMLDTESLQPWETCAMCHGYDGNSAMAKFPKLAGQKQDYLAKQISDFKSGLRANDGGQMVNMVTGLSPSDINQITDWFAGQSHPQPTPSGLSDSEKKQASDLFYNDSTDHQACIFCHNNKSPDIPFIQGQHASYLSKQLTDFKDQNRTNDNGVMQPIAKNLSAEQIDILAKYTASLNREGSP